MDKSQPATNSSVWKGEDALDRNRSNGNDHES